MTSRAQISLRELAQLALPDDAVLVAGEEGLSVLVTWITSLRASFPLLGELAPGYLVLARIALARQLDPRITTGYLLNQLARAEAAGLIIDEVLAPQDQALADELSLPVFLISGADFPVLERELLRTLVDRESQYARRESEIRQQLRDLYDRSGVEDVLRYLSSVLEGQVILYDTDGVIIGQTADLAQASIAHERTHPIAMGSRPLGQLVILMGHAKENTLGTLHIQVVAEVCSLELLQRRVRQETEEALGAELVEFLLATDQTPEAVISRFRRLDYSIAPNRRHCVIALEISQETGGLPLCEALVHNVQWAAVRDEAQVVWARYKDHMLAFCSFDRSIPERRVRAWLTEGIRGLNRPCCVAGVSRIVEGIEGLRDAVDQASNACRLGQLVSGCEIPYYYQDLGLYRLLGSLSERDEVWRFYGETIGPLATYDREHKTELVHTLDTFFTENTNISSTARRLYVHRNTLNYRLQRIVEISGMDLNDPEDRLALQLGLKVHRLHKDSR